MWERTVWDKKLKIVSNPAHINLHLFPYDNISILSEIILGWYLVVGYHSDWISTGWATVCRSTPNACSLTNTEKSATTIAWDVFSVVSRIRRILPSKSARTCSSFVRLCDDGSLIFFLTEAELANSASSEIRFNSKTNKIPCRIDYPLSTMAERIQKKLEGRKWFKFRRRRVRWKWKLFRLLTKNLGSSLIVSARRNKLFAGISTVTLSGDLKMEFHRWVKSTVEKKTKSHSQSRNNGWALVWKNLIE